MGGSDRSPDFTNTNGYQLLKIAIARIAAASTPGP